MRAACLAAETVQDPDFAARIHVPTLIVAAGAERWCRRGRSSASCAACRLGQMLTIDGARHEISQEADLYREQYLAAFDAFVPGSDPAYGSRQ